MFSELVDVLRCPRPHEESWLVLAAHRLDGRDIMAGVLGCPVCHADPSGGELLTAYGRVQSDELLRMKYGKSKSESSHNELKAPRLVRNLELKTDALSGTDDDADPEAKSAGDAKATDEEAPAADTQAEAAPTAAASTDESGSYGDFLWGVKLPDWLLLGGSYRHRENGD